MRYRRLISGAAMTALIGLVSALTFLPSRPAFAASDNLLTYEGGGKGAACGESNYDTCPQPPCVCLTSTGSASGALTGKGFAILDIIVTEPPAPECQQFNASIFVIAPRDLEELDFSGTSCDGMRTFSGNYVIAISQAAHSGSGTFSGTKSSLPLKYRLSFH